MEELLIKDARIIDSSQNFYGDLYIKDGVIQEIGSKLSKKCDVVNGEGLILLPSFIDLHSHFRDPGQTYKEDVFTGSMAAVKGGYTAVNLMANTNPVCSGMDIVDYIKLKSEEIGLLDIHQSVSITKNLEGNDINHLNGLEAGVKSISDDGRGVQNSKVMLDAMVKAKEKGIIVISHAENEELTNVSSRLAENTMTWRDISLGKFTGCRLHIAHVSTEEAMKNIVEEKKSGSNITCEVTPHHLFLTSEVDYKVNPPLREKEDINCLIRAIQEGWVDAIATDHAPHSAEDKLKGANGISGLETSFSVCYTKLVKGGYISLNRLSELMSRNPAKIMGLNKGEIKIGYDGDLVLVDINKQITVNAESFLSKGKNTPFHGMKLYGEVEKTIRKGKIVFSRT